MAERGFSFISIVLSLAVGGLVYLGYLNLHLGGSEMERAVSTKDVSQGVACQMNRRSIERSITTWAISHPGGEPTIEQLQRDGVTVLPCPDGGRFRIQAQKVYCSLHD